MSDATDVPKKRGGFGRLLMTVLGGAVLLGGGFAGGYFLGGPQPSPAEEVLRLIERTGATTEDSSEATPEKQVREAPETAFYETSYYEFPEPLTTNLRGSRRFLQVGVGLSTQYDGRVVANVETHALALRSDMLAVVGSYTEEDVADREGRERLATEIRDALNARLERLEGFGGIEGVFFPSFVLQ